MIDPYQQRGRRARRAYTARRIALIVLITVLLLGFMFAATGCGTDPGHVRYGSITALRFEPAHDEDVEVEDYSIICTGGQYPVCTPIVIGSHTETHHQPDQWWAKAFSCDSGGCWDFERDVDRSVYCGLAIGSWVDFDKPDDYVNVSRYARTDDPSCVGVEHVTASEPVSEGE